MAARTLGTLKDASLGSTCKSLVEVGGDASLTGAAQLVVCEDVFLDRLAAKTKSQQGCA